jgi:hypothetical protein
MSSSFVCVSDSLTTARRVSVFADPLEPTKKAASPRGLDVSPEAAALLAAHRWTFSASQRSDAVSPFLIQASCQIGLELDIY